MTVGAEARIASVVKDYLPGIGAVGVVLYGLFRLAYVFFYVRVRTTPEEVGYAYARIIAESIFGAVELILICAVLIAVVTTAILLVRGAAAAFRRRQRRPRGRRLRWADLRADVDRRILTRVARWSLVAAAVTVFFSLPCLAWWQGGLAQAGQTVRNVYFIGIPYLPVLAVQAVPADISWADHEREQATPLGGRKCLLYLGKADGTTVFYDVFTRDSLRLPSGEIVISLRYAFFVPDVCRVKR